MSFQAYLDNIETKTGKTPNEFIELAKIKGFGKDTKAGDIVSWLKQDYELGHGHAMALAHVIRNGAKIGDKHGQYEAGRRRGRGFSRCVVVRWGGPFCDCGAGNARFCR